MAPVFSSLLGACFGCLPCLSDGAKKARAPAPKNPVIFNPLAAAALEDLLITTLKLKQKSPRSGASSPRGSLKAVPAKAVPAPPACAEAPSDLYDAAQSQLLAYLDSFYRLPPLSQGGALDIGAEEDQATETCTSADALQRLNDRLTKSLAEAGESNGDSLAIQASIIQAIRWWLAAQTPLLAACDTVLALLTPALQALQANLSQVTSTYSTGASQPADAAAVWTVAQIDLARAFLGLLGDLLRHTASPCAGAPQLRSSLVVLLFSTVGFMSVVSSMLQAASAMTTPSDVVGALDLLHRALRLLPQQAVAATLRTGSTSETGDVVSTPHTTPAANAAAVNAPAWAAHLEELLCPSGGVIHALIAQPFNKTTGAAHLAALPVLRAVYELEAGGTLPPCYAQLHVQLFWQSFQATYNTVAESSSGPRSGTGQLCMRYLELVRAAIASPSPAVRAVLRHHDAVAMLLSEFALESQLYAAEHAAVKAREDNSSYDSDEDSFTSSSYVSSSDDGRSTPATDSGSGGGTPRSSGGGAPNEATRMFKFTYDMNKDLRQIRKIEKATGQKVILKGFAYDEEGKALLRRNEEMERARKAEAAAAAAAAAASGQPPPAPRPSPVKPVLPPFRLGPSPAVVHASPVRVTADPQITADVSSSMQRSLSGRLCQAHLNALIEHSSEDECEPSDMEEDAAGSDSRRIIEDSKAVNIALTPASSGQSVSSSRLAAVIEEKDNMDVMSVDAPGPMMQGSKLAFVACVTPANAAMVKVPSLNFSSLSLSSSTLRVTTALSSAQQDQQPAATMGSSSVSDCSTDLSVSESGDLGGEMSAVVVAAPAPSKYALAVAAKPWAHDAQLHVSLLSTLVNLLITSEGHLDSSHIQPLPLDSNVRHTELILSWHFTAPLGVSVARLLAQQLGSSGPCLRLLRLLSRECFDQSRYTDILPFARGAFGRIYRAKRLPAPGSSEPVQHVVIKSIELTSSGLDASPLSAVFSEVSALERYVLAPCPLTMLGGGGTGCVVLPAAANGARVGHPGVCQILDYGLTDSAYWVVLRRYNSSLSEWRHTQQPATALSPAAIAVYLSVLQQLAATMQALATDAVVHFDLKGANVLVEPLEGVRDSQLYGAPPPPPCQPLFRVVIADFGEAQSYSSTEKAYTVRSRGTEACKSPEMLLIKGAGEGMSAEDRVKGGAGLTSDIWSFGCLIYELCAGRLLLEDADYASVTHRVAFGAGPYLELTSKEVAFLGPLGASHLAPLIQDILMRDPARRPSWGDIQQRLAEVRQQVLDMIVQ